MTETLTEAAVLHALRSVEDPDLHRDIVSLGFVKDLKLGNGDVSFKIELTTPACPVRDLLKEDARKHVAALPGVKSVDVVFRCFSRGARLFDSYVGAMSLVNYLGSSVAVALGEPAQERLRRIESLHAQFRDLEP